MKNLLLLSLVAVLTQASNDQLVLEEIFDSVRGGI